MTLCPNNRARRPCPEAMIQNKCFLFPGFFSTDICYHNKANHHLLTYEDPQALPCDLFWPKEHRQHERIPHLNRSFRRDYATCLKLLLFSASTE